MAVEFTCRFKCRSCRADYVCDYERVKARVGQALAYERRELVLGEDL